MELTVGMIVTGTIVSNLSRNPQQITTCGEVIAILEKTVIVCSQDFGSVVMKKCDISVSDSKEES